MRIPLLTGLLCCTAFCAAQNPCDSARIASLLNVLAERHFAPRSLDDRFSEDVYTTYLRALDPDTLLIAPEERRTLEQHRLRIDDELRQGVPAFVRVCDSVMHAGLQRAMLMVDAAGQGRGATSQERHWEKRIQAQAQELEAALNIASPEGSNSERAWTLAATRMRTDLQRSMDQGKNERFELFLATLAGVHDAQSTYLSAEESSGFQQVMTSTFVGVGVTLVRDGMHLRVEEMEPGGPAVRTGRVAPGDVLVQVSDAKGMLIPVLGMDVDEVVPLLRGPLGSEVKLLLRGSSGLVKEVAMQRATIRPDAGRAQAYMLPVNGIPIGVITLPRFYADLSGGEGPRCSADVALLLDSLMIAEVNGLVIDLRDNQGGSMSETIRLLGLFLPATVVAQRVGKDGSVRALSTTEAQARYRGPLVVLVNDRSASASEFFSAALQDHHRAVIMGGPRTYGKGTIQTLVDLPAIAGPGGVLVASGAAKLTVGLFFRPSGGTVQLHGVTPDVVFTSTRGNEPTGERALAFALEPAAIGPAVYTPWALEGAVPLAVLERARARIFNGHPAMVSTIGDTRTFHAPWASGVAPNDRVVTDQWINHALFVLQDLNTTAAAK